MPLEWIIPLGTLGLAGALWIGKIAVEKLVARGVDQRFDRRLEDHRHSLAMSAEHARFDLQRDLANFHLYTGKRYAAAESVYTKVRIAHGSVAGLFGVKETPTFQEYTKSEIDAYLVSRDLAEGMRLQILGTWDTDRNASLAVLNPYLRMLEVQSAHQDLIAAQNEIFLNELYMSEAAGKVLNELFAMLGDWVYIAKNPTHGLQRKYTRAQLQAALTAVHQLLRAELRDGPSASAVAVAVTSVQELPEAT